MVGLNEGLERQLPANKLAGLQKSKLTSLSASSTTLRENI